ncbi:hypothetical protein TPHA_0A04850 [Tetrapisispora phaffii CBS 4417]|uniref:Acyl-CoA thioesterase II n=1 Tax=Tetrapisispora phaffii (strain ATCC 24235 / CBS 4417 / NBRC 1672 / NRRL Y-8282 / UCD 70-5) TaxID=1071381 RepID=G8BNT2_TETPH|nr:hypothetical protein TPHA_0A04850 [Tetrapisispora phaffii CBS 4417]CCE61560.1 hypothetical protein TPHA_0A04850 [Tetrapisispora phaffii CBS 4417]
MSYIPVALEKILELAPVSANRFITTSLPAAPIGGKGTFGGTLVGQSLLAAFYTVPDDFSPVSLHSYFISGGNPSVMIQYHVQDLRHGKNFMHKQVKGYQHEKLIFTSIILFSKKRLHDSLHHLKTIDADSMPSLTKFEPADKLFKDKIVSNAKIYEKASQRFQDVSNLNKSLMNFKHGPVEYRFPKSIFYSKEAKDKLGYYVKCREKINKHFSREQFDKITPENDPRYAYIALAYISDAYFLLTLPSFHALPLFSHKFSVSLDHSIHFHQIPNISDFTYFEISNISSRSDKHLMVGEYYNAKTKEIVASVSQEGYVIYDDEETIRSKF